MIKSEQAVLRSRAAALWLCLLFLYFLLVPTAADETTDGKAHRAASDSGLVATARVATPDREYFEE